MKRINLLFVGVFIVLSLATCSRPSYAKDLSKVVSVTPQRYCGFFAPQTLSASQVDIATGARVYSYTIRLQSLYEGMTQQNKPAMANMLGGTYEPRVNPLTLFHSVNSHNSKIVGGYHA